MGRLILVRHAQASFLSPNYDQLSALGESQAQLLGDYWSRRNLRFDRVASGPAERHRRTVQIVAETCHNAGAAFPEMQPMPEFDEFQGEAVLSEGLPKLIPSNDRIRDLHAAMLHAGSETEKRVAFQRLFESVISMWVDGKIALNNVETWSAFSSRVNRGLSDFLSAARKGGTSVIFTSGGTIAIAVQRALHLSARDTLQIAWMSRNSSFTEFLFSGDRLTLSSFNAFPHLTDEALLTYR